MGHAIVIGLGKSGIAAARLLRRQGWQVTVSDRGNSEALQAVQQTLAAEGIAVKLGQSPWLEGASRVVVSPGVPWDSFPLLQARALGLEVVGEMELAWQALKAVPWIGITGTNGKTTVTALIESIFQAADLKAPACGNIGYAACEVALEAAGTAPPDWVIAEVSSYQIEASATLAPAISLWTTFTPDHLSRHVTLGRYYDIKAQLLRRSQLAVFNGDDPYLRQRHEDWPNAHWVTAQPEVSAITAAAATAVIEADWVWVAGQKLLPVADLPMPGEHNRQNVLMAVAAAHLAGISPEAIAQGVRTFPGVPHRLEPIIRQAGVTFINDSKATNYDAAEVGLCSVTGPVVLIAGGEPKTGEDGPWLARIKEKAVTVLLIGQAASAFAERLNQVGYHSHKQVESLEVAVPLAATLAKTHSAKTVLLSPACASFDQYRSFEHRGEHFRQLCEALPPA